MRSSSKFPSRREKRAKVSRSEVEKIILGGADAEFLLEKAKAGKFYLRIGQVWKIPELRGTTAILLDLDNCKRASFGNIVRRLLQCGLQTLRIIQKRSPSGCGLHIVVYVAGHFTRYQRIALQAICESDPSREANNFRRAMLAGKEWKENWNVLFR